MKENGWCIFDNPKLTRLTFPDGDPNPCEGSITQHYVQYKRGELLRVKTEQIRFKS